MAAESQMSLRLSQTQSDRPDDSQLSAPATQPDESSQRSIVQPLKRRNADAGSMISEDVSLSRSPSPLSDAGERKVDSPVTTRSVRKRVPRPDDSTGVPSAEEHFEPQHPVMATEEDYQRQWMFDANRCCEEALRGMKETNKRKRIQQADLKTQHSKLREKIEQIYEVAGTQSSQDTVVDEEQAAAIARDLTTVGKKLRKVEKEVASLNDQIDRVGRTTMYAKQVFEHQAESKEVAFKIFQRLHPQIRSFECEAAARYNSAKDAREHTMDMPQANGSLTRAISSEHKASNAICDAMHGVQVALWPLVQLTTAEQQKQLVKDNNQTFLMAFDEAGRQNKDADTESDHE
jgi:hypothetical protein